MAEEIVSNEEIGKMGTIQNVKWDHFPDGYPNVFIDKAHTLPGKRIVLILSLYNKEEIFEQLSLLYALPRHSVRSLLIILSYFPTGTMERVDLKGQIATAKTLCRMLSCTPPTSRGPPQVLIYDIHALQEQFYFADSILPQLQTAIPMLVSLFDTEYKREDIAIAFPDEGAFKRFNKLLPSDIPTITCMKIRQGNSRIVSIMEGEPQGKTVIVIDDLVQSGGTLLACKNALLEHGASNVSCFVTHAIFPNASWKKFTEEPKEKAFQKFYVTNSCPEVTSQLENHEPFKVLSLAPSICQFLSENL